MINTREIAAEYRLVHWARIMQEQKASGQSIKEYCRATGFHPNKYYYWQRKLRAAACDGLSTIVEQKAIAPSGWVAVVESKANNDETSLLPIEIGNCRILVNASTEMELLARVCKTLASLC